MAACFETSEFAAPSVAQLDWKTRSTVITVRHADGRIHRRRKAFEAANFSRCRCMPGKELYTYRCRQLSVVLHTLNRFVKHKLTYPNDRLMEPPVGFEPNRLVLAGVLPDYTTGAVLKSSNIFFKDLLPDRKDTTSFDYFCKQLFLTFVIFFQW